MYLKKYLLNSYCVLDSGLGVENTSVTKTVHFPLKGSQSFGAGEQVNRSSEHRKGSEMEKQTKIQVNRIL